MSIRPLTLAPAHYSGGFALLFVLLWSTGFIGARLGLPHTEPLTFLLFRYSAVIVLLTVVAVLVGKHLFDISLLDTAWAHERTQATLDVARGTDAVAFAGIEQLRS